mgnify:CR=1 FL=1
MGNPKLSYYDMVREACRFVNWGKKVNECSEVKDLELRLKTCKHNNEFYFKCGIAATKVVNDICTNGSCDEMNAMLGGLSMFENLIGLEDE